MGPMENNVKIKEGLRMCVEPALIGDQKGSVKTAQEVRVLANKN